MEPGDVKGSETAPGSTFGRRANAATRDARDSSESGSGGGFAAGTQQLVNSSRDFFRRQRSRVGKAGGASPTALLFIGVVAVVLGGSIITGGSLWRRRTPQPSLDDDAALSASVRAAEFAVLPSSSALPIRIIRAGDGESDDDSIEEPIAEDDDDGVVSMQKRLRALRPAAAAGGGRANADAANPAAAAAAAKANAKRLAAKSAECASRMTGLALMDVNRVLLPRAGDEEDEAASGPAPAMPSSHAGGALALKDFIVPPVHTQPQFGEIDGVQFYRPLTLLLSPEHLVIGDMFMVSAECIVFVTVKNKAQPDWLTLRRILIEYRTDNETIVTPFTSVASSLADQREPVGVGKYCNKAFARSRSVKLTIVYRGQRWPVEVHRSPSRGTSGYAMSTLVGHNWRLLPAWLAYWKKLGVGHFYLYFNDYLPHLAAERDGPALMSVLAAAADYVTVFEWPFKFDVRVKVQKARGEERLRLQHIAQPLRSHSSFYRFRGAHKYMAFFDVDEYLVPSAGFNTLSELIRGQDNKPRISPIYSFSNRWAASPVGDFRGLLKLEDIARAGVFADSEVVPNGRTKMIITTRSKVVFVHVHKATTSAEYVKSATKHVLPSSASFFHFTNLEACHGSVAVDVVEQQAGLTDDPSRRDARMAALLARALPKLKLLGDGPGGGGSGRGEERAPKRNGRLREQQEAEEGADSGGRGGGEPSGRWVSPKGRDALVGHMADALGTAAGSDSGKEQQPLRPPAASAGRSGGWGFGLFGDSGEAPPTVGAAAAAGGETGAAAPFQAAGVGPAATAGGASRTGPSGEEPEEGDREDRPRGSSGRAGEKRAPAPAAQEEDGYASPQGGAKPPPPPRQQEGEEPEEEEESGEPVEEGEDPSQTALDEAAREQEAQEALLKAAKRRIKRAAAGEEGEGGSAPAPAAAEEGEDYGTGARAVRRPAAAGRGGGEDAGGGGAEDEAAAGSRLMRAAAAAATAALEREEAAGGEYGGAGAAGEEGGGGEPEEEPAQRPVRRRKRRAGFRARR